MTSSPHTTARKRLARLAALGALGATLALGTAVGRPTPPAPPAPTTAATSVCISAGLVVRERHQPQGRPACRPGLQLHAVRRPPDRHDAARRVALERVDVGRGGVRPGAQGDGHRSRRNRPRGTTRRRTPTGATARRTSSCRRPTTTGSPTRSTGTTPARSRGTRRRCRARSTSGRTATALQSPMGGPLGAIT